MNVKRKLLIIIILLQAIIAASMLVEIARDKRQAHIVSPPLNAWYSRIGNMTDTWRLSDDFSDEQGDVDFLYGPYIALEKGSYVFRIDYSCDHDQECYVHAYENTDNLPDKTYRLPAKRDMIKGHFTVKSYVGNAELRVVYTGEGSIEIRNIVISTSSFDALRHLGLFIIISILVDICVVRLEDIIICCKKKAAYLKEYARAILVPYPLESGERIEGLDVLKLIASLCVVSAHVPGGSGYIGIALWGVYRCTVPIFFLISGYFYDNMVAKRAQIKQIKHVLLLIIVSNFLYFVLDSCVYGIGIYRSRLDGRNIFNMLLLNDSPFSEHLWYLNALLYVLLTIAIAEKIKAEKFIFLVSPILLMVGLIFGMYSKIFFHGEIFDPVLTRNFIFIGIPFFSFGIILRRIGRIHTYSLRIIIGLCVIFFLFAETEVLLMDYYNKATFGDLYFGSIFLSIGLFLLFLLIPAKGGIVHILSRLGKKYSGTIYIIHIAILFLIMEVVGRSAVDSRHFSYTIVVFLLSLLVSYVFENVKKLKFCDKLLRRE